jgi:hypothetical protein
MFKKKILAGKRSNLSSWSAAKDLLYKRTVHRAPG